MNGSKSWRLLLYHGARVSERKKTSWCLDILYRWYVLVYCHLVNLPHMFSTRIHQSRNARSNGQAVMLERTWKRAWHGSSLHRIEEIAQKGLKVGKKGSLGHWKLDLPKDSENGLATAWWKDEGNGRRIKRVERRCFGNCSVRWVQTGRFHLCFPYEPCLWEPLLCLDSSVWLSPLAALWLLLCFLVDCFINEYAFFHHGLSSCWDDLHHVMTLVRNPKIRY